LLVAGAFLRVWLIGGGEPMPVAGAWGLGPGASSAVGMGIPGGDWVRLEMGASGFCLFGLGPRMGSFGKAGRRALSRRIPPPAEPKSPSEAGLAFWEGAGDPKRSNERHWQRLAASCSPGAGLDLGRGMD
jgi:hypothetical protein